MINLNKRLIANTTLSIIGILSVMGIILIIYLPTQAENNNVDIESLPDYNEVSNDSANNKALSNSQYRFRAYEPTFIPEGLKKLEMNQYDSSDGIDTLNVIELAWVDDKAVSDPEHKQLLIVQSSDDGSRKPMDILSEGEKIFLDENIEAWVINPALKDPTQIMFWKNDQYFNVRGQNIPVETLIKVANSLE